MLVDVLGLLFWLAVVAFGALLLAADVLALTRWGFRGTQERLKVLFRAIAGDRHARVRLAEYIAGRELSPRPDYRRIGLLERDLGLPPTGPRLIEVTPQEMLLARTHVKVAERLGQQPRPQIARIAEMGVVVADPQRPLRSPQKATD